MSSILGARETIEDLRCRPCERRPREERRVVSSDLPLGFVLLGGEDSWRQGTQRRDIGENGGVGGGEGEGARELTRQASHLLTLPFSRTIRKIEEKQGEREGTSRQSLDTAPWSALSA